ncbi:MAG: competence/damage-inducible protein A [Nitritalea sp.]
MAYQEVSAAIIAVGDELLYGQIVDTNSQWISQSLDRIGVRVVLRLTVGDNEADMLAAFRQAEERADVVLITGGLGPTNDDLTKPLLAKYFGSSLALVPEALESVRQFFEKRGRPLTRLNELQAHLPTNCRYVENSMGTAPGMWFHERGTYWMSMPGVPYEMKHLMEHFVLPELKRCFPLPMIYHKVIKTVGIGESWLAEVLQDWESALPAHIKLAYLPSLGHVKLRLSAFGEEQDSLVSDVSEQIEAALPLIGKYIYGYDDDSLSEAVGRLLRQQKKTVALAESCSGGYIAHMLTEIPGASAYFEGGIIPYHNRHKAGLLNVSEQVLAHKGAVSEETVAQMAEGVRRQFGSDIGLSSSGIAGPSGGWAEKPVGTVWIACATEKGVRTKKLQLTADRGLNIRLTGISVLNLLRQELANISE